MPLHNEDTLLQYTYTSDKYPSSSLESFIMLNLLPEEIMQEILHNHHKSISIGGRPIYNLRFANDTDLMGGGNIEQVQVVQESCYLHPLLWL